MPHADPKARAAYNRAWRVANRFAVATSQRAKALRREHGGELTTADVRTAMTAPEGCAYCGGPLDVLEHCTPLSRGGANDGSNVIGSCYDCNDLKHTKTVLEFLGLWPEKGLQPAPF